MPRSPLPLSLRSTTICKIQNPRRHAVGGFLLRREYAPFLPSRLTCWLQPNPNSQTVGTITSANRFGRLTATALLQRRCGYLANYPLNSAFAVPERVELGADSRGEASALQGKGFLKGKTVGFSLERSSFVKCACALRFSSRRGEKSTYMTTLLHLSPRGGRKVPKERHQREGPTVLPFGNLTPHLRTFSLPRKCLRAVKSALRLVPATGSERHPSRSTLRVATYG